MPTTIVRCVNPDCRFKGEPRTASLDVVGDGLHGRPTVVCECGQPVLTSDGWGTTKRVRPEVEERPTAPPEVETAKPAKKTQTKSAPEKRG